MLENNSVLIVAAHPDDEVLGCGGTIARLVQNRFRVHIAILGEGITSRYADREKVNRSLVQKLHLQSHKAVQALGVKNIQLFEFPDNRFDTVPLLEVVKIIEKLVTEIQPSTIYTHHNADLNIDHQIVHRAVLTATRPIKGCPVRDIYAFEVPSSSEWSFYRAEPTFRPNVFIDISKTLKNKINAFSLYHGEVRKFPHPRSPESLRVIAKRWGSVVGVQAAEAFELIRLIK